ncbi:hypothetical protein AVEN_235332-1 [Araneus ventricosus]|uniref:Uncharacterized protein n=1 Tax=Araneus ventricosus TaxID=182803 RepID=A0A4Y2A533_ARAVE|nr:hypothetical protein AVEN_235332-1 [Araneus ventricosus]
MSLMSRNCCQRTRSCGATCRLKCFTCTHTWTFSLKIYEQVSNEHWERFHPDIAQFERRFSGKWNASMLAEYSGHWYEKLLFHGTRGRQTPDEGTIL